MASHGNETDITQMVTQYIAGEIWTAFPYAPIVDGRIVWEYGIVEAIVDFALHGRRDRTFLGFAKSRGTETFAIVQRARELADGLARKESATLLLLLGLEDISRNPKLTKNAALEEAAEEIFQVREGSFSRRFEHARRAVEKIVSKIQGEQKASLEQIGELGPASRLVPAIALKYPKVFKLLDDKLRDRG